MIRRISTTRQKEVGLGRNIRCLITDLFGLLLVRSQPRVSDSEAIFTYIVRYLAIAGIGGLVFSRSRDSAKEESSHIAWSCVKAFFVGGLLTLLLCFFSGWLFPALIYDSAVSESLQMVALLLFGAVCAGYGAYRGRC